MAYEAMNNAGALGSRLIVVLNDNNMSIAPPTGALSTYLARITSSRSYLFWRNFVKRLAKCLPKRWERRVERLELFARHFWQGGVWFEELGFYYVGPIDGHDLQQLCRSCATSATPPNGPILRPRRHQEGKGLRAGRSVRGQISRRQQVQRADRSAGEIGGQGADLSRGCSPTV